MERNRDRATGERVSPTCHCFVEMLMQQFAHHPPSPNCRFYQSIHPSPTICSASRQAHPPTPRVSQEERDPYSRVPRYRLGRITTRIDPAQLHQSRCCRSTGTS
jgi:hypothetical protein